jgi:hypothetical protein
MRLTTFGRTAQQACAEIRHTLCIRDPRGGYSVEASGTALSGEVAAQHRDPREFAGGEHSVDPSQITFARAINRRANQQWPRWIDTPRKERLPEL